MRAGGAARIFRPTATLFLLLKLGRLSEQDLSDCALTLERVRAESLALDRDRVVAALDALGPTVDEALARRRQTLRAMVLREA